MKESTRSRVYYNDNKRTTILMMLFVFNAVILTILSVSHFQHQHQQDIQRMHDFRSSSTTFFRQLVDEEGADEDDEYQAEIIVFDDDDDERQKQMTKEIAWYHLDRYLERNTLLYDLAEGFLYVADGFFIMWVVLGCMVRFGCLSKENWDESLFFGGGGLNQKFMRRRRYKRIHDGRGVFAPVPTNIDEDGYYYDDNENDEDGEDDEDNFSQASRESMEYGTCSTVVSVSSKKSVRSYVSTGGKSLDNRSLVSTKSAPGGIITGGGDDDYYGNKQIDIRKEAMKLVKEAENYFQLGDRKAQQRKEKKEEMDALGLLLDLEMAEVPIIHPKVSNRKPKQQEQTGMIITTTTADDSTNNNNNNNPSTTANENNNNSNINTTTNDDDDSDSDDSDVVVFV